MKLGERRSQHQHPASGLHSFGAEPRQEQARQIAERELVVPTGNHDELVRAVNALVLVAVAGVAPGQRAQRHRAAHETEIGVRFAGRDKLVHLVGLGEVVACLGRGVADRLDRAAQIGQSRISEISVVSIWSWGNRSLRVRLLVKANLLHGQLSPSR